MKERGLLVDLILTPGNLTSLFDEFDDVGGEEQGEEEEAALY